MKRGDIYYADLSPVVGSEQGGVRPLPRWLMALLNGLVNLLRSVPFLILMIIVKNGTDRKSTRLNSSH